MEDNEHFLAYKQGLEPKVAIFKESTWRIFRNFNMPLFSALVDTSIWPPKE